MSNEFLDNTGLSIDGHVMIKDATTGDVLLDKHNAINFENFALAAAGSLVSNGDYSLSMIHFGNGGTQIDQVGNITYKAPDVNDIYGTLYSKTYEKPISAEIVPFANEAYSDIVCSVILDYDEPSDQLQVDNISDNTDYVFDELGLVTASGLYLTHLIFHPIQKAANRKIEIIYTVRIRAGQ